MVHSSSLFALVAYAIAQSLRGGFKPRPLGERMRSLGSAWIVLAASIALGAEGLFLLAAFIVAVLVARQVLPSPVSKV